MTDGTVTYMCEPVRGLSLLYNVNNKFRHAEQRYKDGKVIGPELREVSLLEDDDWTRRRANSIINAAFNTEQKKAVKGDSFGIGMNIDPDTGKVIEVDLTFYSTGKFGTIPLSVYTKIERQLKNNVWFTPTEAGKKLNFIRRYWRHEFD